MAAISRQRFLLPSILLSKQEKERNNMLRRRDKAEKKVNLLAVLCRSPFCP